MTHFKSLALTSLIFSAPFATAAAAEKVIDVTKAGALGDGVTLNTVAIQKAIDDCATAGGGTVHFPVGHYLTGSLVLKSHTSLQIDAGATISGSGNRDDYPIVRARWEGIDSDCHRALISADHAEDIAITGAGVIEGNPEVSKLRSPRGAPVIETIECGNVRMEGVTLKSSRMWTLHPTYSHDVRISGVTFETVFGNSDGIDPDSCQRVTIDGCTFSTGDDSIALKSGKGQEGVKIGRPCEDIVITNCTFNKGYTSIAFGSELSGGIRRVRIANCTFKQGRAALQFKMRPGRGGYVEDVVAEHLVVGPEPLLETTSSYSYNPDPQGVPGINGLTQFRDIRIDDVKIASKHLMDVSAPAEKPLDGLRISHVTGTCERGSVLENVRNVTLTDIHLAGISGPAYSIRNVTGTGLDGAVPLPEPKPKTGEPPAALTPSTAR